MESFVIISAQADQDQNSSRKPNPQNPGRVVMKYTVQKGSYQI
jgi:hypothetical protein